MIKKSIPFALIISLAVFSLSVIFLNIAKPNQDNICGEWKGESQGMELLFKFHADGTCELNFEDKAMPSNTTETLNGNFVLDSSKVPIPLTIKNIPQINTSLFTIVEFTTDHSLRIAYFATRWRLRPIVFSPNKYINLSRADDSST